MICNRGLKNNLSPFAFPWKGKANGILPQELPAGAQEQRSLAEVSFCKGKCNSISFFYGLFDFHPKEEKYGEKTGLRK